MLYMTTQTFENIDEAINKFYTLKNNYETEFKQKYVSKILSMSISPQEKRIEFSKLPKPKCVNCSRNVGTLFKISKPEGEDRVFSAKCGDLAEPCPLNINISVGEMDTYSHFISINNKEVNTVKNDLIKEKNNYLFGYKSTAVSATNYEQLTKDLTDMTRILGHTIEENILKTDNPVKFAQLTKMQEEFEIGYIIPFKNLVDEYNKTNNELLINEAVKFYINDMVPIINNIQHAKYELNYIDYSVDTNTYHLIQRKNNLKSLEFTYGKNKLNKFVTGILKSTKAKTLKNNQPIPLQQKPKPILVIEDEDISSENTF